jgi:hypothetical protein
VIREPVDLDDESAIAPHEVDLVSTEKLRVDLGRREIGGPE